MKSVSWLRSVAYLCLSKHWPLSARPPTWSGKLRKRWVRQHIRAIDTNKRTHAKVKAHLPVLHSIMENLIKLTQHGCGKLKGFKATLSEAYGSVISSQCAWERYRLNSIYSAFFGNNTATTMIPGGPLGVWDIASSLYGLNIVWGNGTGDPGLIVVCDDAPYVSKNTSSGSFVFADPYHHLSVELPGDDIVNDGITTPCATNGQSGYSYFNDHKFFFANVIFCTKNMKLPLGFTSNGPTAFASGTTLDVAGKTWLGAFYTQALWNGGAVGTVRNYTLTYGYAASHAMSNNRFAVFNPDSNKVFSFAQMLDGLFWGSGVGQTSQQ
ncbi:hypothetical protein GGI42DRAFT_222007 [Trichoderma sp. SZMC 28013]